MAITHEQSKKSGIRTIKPGEVLFHQNDPALSLFIIQSGQIRLFIPKGRGFVDLAILRAGEVIGEMAYFDENNRRRSCSATAIVSTDVVEISFNAFEKTMQGLNPWFKTIINTLAERLRKTNDKVKSLESNSVGFGKEGKVADYVFFHTTDVMKILSTMYLVIKNHGEQKDGYWEVHMNKLKFYLFDVFNIPEIKLEEFMNMLKGGHFLNMKNDEDGLPKIVRIEKPDEFRSIAVFLNTQRMIEDSKKLTISLKCERFLKRIIQQFKENDVDKPKWQADISSILEDFKARKVPVHEGDLGDAINAGIAEEILVGDNNKLTSVIDYDKLKKVFPAICMMNAIKKTNEVKAKNG